MSESVDSEFVVDCGKTLEVSRCRQFRDSLKAALESGQSVAIDVSSIERIDAAGLQLLCAFMRKAQQCQRSVRWREPSTAFTHSARLLDLSRYLNLS